MILGRRGRGFFSGRYDIDGGLEKDSRLDRLVGSL
jgi:hypothetical protein